MAYGSTHPLLIMVCVFARDHYLRSTKTITDFNIRIFCVMFALLAASRE